MRGGRPLLCVVLAAMVAASIGVAVATGGPQEPRGVPTSETGDLLPDLDVAAPADLLVQSAVADGARVFRLSFASAAENVGHGPLTIEGSRVSLGDPRMVATQVVQRVDGGTRRIPGIGQLEYVRDPTHEHWHLLTFMTYELRRARNFTLVRPDEKTGFCLGDRYVSDRWGRLPERASAPAYVTNCGPGETGLLGLTEGISVGFGDDYEPWRDAQWIDLTGVPAGRYVLVHRVNAERTLLEVTRRNNASSLSLSLTWPRGMNRLPVVRVLATCPDTPSCPAPSGSR